MNLVVDIGNTRTKIAFFEGEKLMDNKFFNDPEVCDLELELRGHLPVENCIVSASAEIDTFIYRYLNNTFPKLIHLSGNTPLPFVNTYESKNTQGPDRIAAVAGAISLYPNTPLLVVDAGTAITYDFVDDKNKYLGGNIAPGLTLRYKSLHDYTAKLPLCERKEDFELIGKNTNDAIVNGVQLSILFEIHGYIEEFSKLYPKLTSIMTGGDADFLANKLKRSIFVNSNLVLIGLNRILNYNAQL